MAFLVPEASRILAGYFATKPADGNNGAFLLPSPVAGWILFCIASDSSDPDAAGLPPWEHVSVTARRPSKLGSSRTPTWAEMCAVKHAFWSPADVVVQFHPAAADYINNHPHCLHLWAPIGQVVPVPPSIYVGTMTSVFPPVETT